MAGRLARDAVWHCVVGQPLRRGEQTHQFVGQPRMLGQQRILHHDDVVDRIDAGLAGPRGGDGIGIRNHAADLVGIDAGQRHCGIDLAGQEASRAGYWPGAMRCTNGGSTNSCTCASSSVTQVIESGAMPYSSRRMPRTQTPVVCDQARTPMRLPTRSAGPRNGRIAPADQRAVMQAAQQHDRQRGDRLAVGTRLRMRRQCDLAQVEFHRARHAAEGARDRIDLDEVEAHAVGGHGAFLQRAHQRRFAERGAEDEFPCHCERREAIPMGLRSWFEIASLRSR